MAVGHVCDVCLEEGGEVDGVVAVPLLTPLDQVVLAEVGRTQLELGHATLSHAHQIVVLAVRAVLAQLPHAPHGDGVEPNELEVVVGRVRDVDLLVLIPLLPRVAIVIERDGVLQNVLPRRQFHRKSFLGAISLGVVSSKRPCTRVILLPSPLASTKKRKNPSPRRLPLLLMFRLLIRCPEKLIVVCSLM